VATRRSKPKLKDRPKHRQAMALKNRKQKARKKAQQKRGLNRSKAGRMRRGGIKKK
jgi:hypothetical protein